jgi:hypothetical protein
VFWSVASIDAKLGFLLEVKPDFSVQVSLGLAATKQSGEPRHP